MEDVKTTMLQALVISFEDQYKFKLPDPDKAGGLYQEVAEWNYGDVESIRFERATVVFSGGRSFSFWCRTGLKEKLKQNPGDFYVEED